MQQRYRLPDGRIVEQTPQGYVVVPDSPAQAGPIVTRRADPRLPSQTAQAAADAERARNEAAASQFAAQRAEADARKAEADARLAEIQAGRGGAPAPAPVSASDADARASRVAALNALTNQLRAVRSLYENNLQGQGLSSIIQALPTPSNRAFNSAGQGLINPFLAAFRIPGVGAQSDLEARQFVEANVPRHNDTDAEIEQKLANIENRVAEYRQAAGIPEEPPVTPPTAATPEQGVDRSARVVVDNPNAGGEMRGSRGTRSVEDPTLRAVATRLGHMVARGDSDERILNYLREAGIDPAQTNIDTALRFRRTRNFQTWRQQNPGRPYPVGADFYRSNVPLGAVENVVNNLAQSPAGAYAVSAANGITLNRLDDIVDATGGDGERARAVQDLIRAENPISSLAGDISGALLAEATVGRVIPGARGFMATNRGRRVADAAHGAAFGSGMGEGTSAEGAVLGGTLGLAGGAAGRRVQSAGGRLLSGARDEGLEFLRERGITPTLGQMARAVSERSLPARVVSGIEDRVAGFPIVGDVVNAARRRTARQFENAAFDEGLAPIAGANAGREGVDAIDNMQNLTGQAYDDALGGVSVARDPQFAGEYGAAYNAAAAIPVHGPGLAHAIDRNLQPLLGGTMTGRELQAAIQTLRAEAAAYRGLPNGQAAADALNSIETSLTGLVGRQAPDVMPRLNAANSAYRNQQILQDATSAAGERPMTPLDLARAARAGTRRYGGRNTAASSRRPFTQLATAGQRVIPSAVPDSGTAGRGALALPLAGGVLGGGGGYAAGGEGGATLEGAGQGALFGAALTAPYSRTGQRALAALLLGRTARDASVSIAGRPISLNLVGEALRNGTRRPVGFGAFGTGMSRDLAILDELED